MAEIKCMVEECKYNSDYYCNASTIQVRSDGVTNVASSSQTACETFSKGGGGG